MKKLCWMLSFVLSSIAFSHPSMNILDQIEAQHQFYQERAVKVPEVGDLVKVKTARAWKLGRVAKVGAFGVLLLSLAPGTEAGPFCWTGVITACCTAALGCVVGSVLNPVVSAACVAAQPEITSACSLALSACSVVP
ncbi:MAG: hypothetical protein OXT67_08565 [Zetaproteobacteria bacterium]|nr:hypothetical protein [Zetaproteobacteria bacterium]